MRVSKRFENGSRMFSRRLTPEVSLELQSHMALFSRKKALVKQKAGANKEAGFTRNSNNVGTCAVVQRNNTVTNVKPLCSYGILPLQGRVKARKMGRVYHVAFVARLGSFF